MKRPKDDIRSRTTDPTGCVSTRLCSISKKRRPLQIHCNAGTPVVHQRRRSSSRSASASASALEAAAAIAAAEFESTSLTTQSSTTTRIDNCNTKKPMHFSRPLISKPDSPDDRTNFELRQYSSIAINYYNAQYRKDPQALERLSKRVRARVEGDSSGLIRFCDKLIRKRRKKLKQKQQKQQKQQQTGHEQHQSENNNNNNNNNSNRATPECIKGTDLVLGACLGQGSFSSVFVLERHRRRSSNQLADDSDAIQLRRKGRRSTSRSSSIVVNSRRDDRTRTLGTRRIGGTDPSPSPACNDTDSRRSSGSSGNSIRSRNLSLRPGRRRRSMDVKCEDHQDNDHSALCQSGGARALRRRNLRTTPTLTSREGERKMRNDNQNDSNETQNDSGGIDPLNDHDNVVVKILQPKLMENPRLFANCAAGLIREGLFLAALSHPHILEIHAWTSPTGWHDFAGLSGKNGKLYDGYILILERLKGGTLRRWLQHWHQEHTEETGKEVEIPESNISNHGSVSSGRWRRTLFGNKHCNSSNNNNKVSGDATISTASTGMAVVDENENDRGRHRHPYPRQWPQAQLSDRIGLLLQLTDTVKYLHKHRILHRDLKPDNLGVTYSHCPKNSSGDQNAQTSTSLSLKIFDFDIARLVPKGEDEQEEHHVNQNDSQPRSLSTMTGGVSVMSSSVSIDQSMQTKSTKRSRRSLVTTDSNSWSSLSFSTRKDMCATANQNGEKLFQMTGKMGSPRYMAPEIARGEAYNLRSEVYTVGLLVHEVLTLQKPYDELQPEEHEQLVHSSIPGYRPPIRNSWNWPIELRQLLETSWGDIRHRPSIRDVHSVLKTSLTKLAAAPASSPSVVSAAATPHSSCHLSQPKLDTPKRARSLFQRPKRKKKELVASLSPVHPISPSPSESSSSMETCVHLITDE